MRKILIIISLLWVSNAWGQDCRTLIEKHFVDKIRNHKPSELLPYFEKGANGTFVCGLMDKNTGQKLTVPLINNPAMFNPTLSFFTSGEYDCEVEIGQNYEFKAAELMIMEMEDDDEDDKIEVEVSSSIKGFKVNKEGKLIAYAKKYQKSSSHFLNVSPFLYKDSYFSVVEEGGMKVVINTNGEIQWKEKYKDIVPTKYRKRGKQLFYIEKEDGKKGFRTFPGRTYLLGDLISYPSEFKSCLGYNLQDDGDMYSDNVTKSGVLDLARMKWIIKPQGELSILDVLYFCEKEIDKSNYKERTKATIYFVVEKNGVRYLIDKKGKEYKAVE